MSKIYELKKDYAGWPAGSIVVMMDDGWRVGNWLYNTRGSIAEGEVAMTFAYWAEHKLTSLLELLEDNDD